MSRHYEVMVILDPDLEERAVSPLIENFLSSSVGGGKVEKVDTWGRRRLAYEIKKKPEGIYSVIDLQAEPEVVKELDRQMNLNESVLRTKVLRPRAARVRLRSSSHKQPAARPAERSSHGRRDRHHGRRQSRRRPRAALHPLRCGGREVPCRVHSPHLRPSDQRVEGRREPVPDLLGLASGGGERRGVAPAGMRVIVQGRLKQRSYEDREGVKRTVYELDVDEVGASLRSATAKVTKASRGGRAATAAAVAARVAAAAEPAAAGGGALRRRPVGDRRAGGGGRRRRRWLRRLRPSGGGYSDEPPF